MKVIIAGSRSITNPGIVHAAIDASRFTITEVVCGYARGVDMIGLRWAKATGTPYKVFPAKWRDKDGELDMQAGYKRNERMAEYADALIAVWDGHSGGTKDMMQRMGKRAKPIYYIDLDL